MGAPPGRLPGAQQPAEKVPEPSARAAGIRRRAGGSPVWSRGVTTASLERLVGEQSEQCHHHRRHSAATAAGARLTLAARAILHATEDIEQSHVGLLPCQLEALGNSLMASFSERLTEH
jgi:hypothetical protein